MPVPGAVCSVSGSTFTGLVLVSVKNPVFLSTEHSVSTWGRDLAQGPQEASSFSYWAPPCMFLQPLISPQLLRAWPDSPLGIPDLGPGGGHFSSTREDCATSLPSAYSFPHSTSQSASPPCGDTGCPLDRCPGGTGDARTMTTPNLGTKSRHRSPHPAQFLNPNSGHPGLGHPLLVGDAVCGGAFLASSHKMLAASPSRDNQKGLQMWHSAEPRALTRKRAPAEPRALTRKPQDDSHNPRPGGGAGCLPAVRLGRTGRIRTKRQHVGGTVRREGGARRDRTGQGLDVDGRGCHSQMPRVTRQS